MSAFALFAHKEFLLCRMQPILVPHKAWASVWLKAKVL